MQLRLQGDAWYLRKMINGKRRDIALGVREGEAGRKKAVKAAEKRIAEMREAQAATNLMKRMGFETPKEETPREVPTFAAWWETYEKNYTSEKAPRTQKIDRQVMKHWLPIFGPKRLDEIKQSDCLDALSQRRGSFTAHEQRKVKTVITESSLLRERRLVQAIFERAVENDHIAKNPWKGVGVRKDAETTRAHRILSEADEPQLMAALTDPIPDATGKMVSMDPRYRRFITFMLETGLRIDELLNEHFKDKGTYVEVVGKFTKPRKIALTTTARRILDEQWKDQGDERSRRPKAKRGLRPWWQCEQRFRQVMEKAAKRAGVPHISPHDLRHTFGHRYLVKGGRIEDLSKILGHATIAVTDRHYGYLRPEDVHAKMLAVMDPIPSPPPAQKRQQVKSTLRVNRHLRAVN